MAMRGENCLVGIRHAIAHLNEHIAIFIRRCITDGIRQIDGRCPRFDGGIDTAAEIINRRPCRIHRRPFDIVNEIACACHGCRDDIEHFRFRLLHLEFEMNRRCRHERMNARLLCEFHRFASAINIGIDGTCETRNRCPLDALGNFRHRFKIAIRGNRETRFDDVDAHRIQEIGDFELLFERHRCAG